jgi:hypothetical protein
MTSARQFFGRLWWAVLIGGAFMMAGLVVALFTPDGNWISTALVAAGGFVALVGYVLILVYMHSHRNDPPPPIDRGHL